jgi:tetratricopeptide (TPR) repeat protein
VTVVTPGSATNVRDLYLEAQRVQAAGEHSKAAALYDALVRYDPRGEFATQALFQGALAHEEAGDHAAAAHRFEQLARGFPEAVESTDALVRAIRLSVYQEQWERAGEQAELLLKRENVLAPRHKVVAFSGRALGLLAKSDVESAERFVSEGRRVVDEFQLDTAGAVPRDLAQLYYALAETRRIRAERIEFTSADHFTRDFEIRAQLLLDAQGAYSDCMRAHDAHWTAMAGFRVGELYQKLHQAVMQVPRPSGADTPRRRQLLEGAMRLRYSVLLDKGIRMLEQTLAMAERTGEQSTWVARSRAVLEELAVASEDEKKAVDALPFSRADLQAVLHELNNRRH